LIIFLLTIFYNLVNIDGKERKEKVSLPTKKQKKEEVSDSETEAENETDETDIEDSESGTGTDNESDEGGDSDSSGRSPPKENIVNIEKHAKKPPPILAKQSGSGSGKKETGAEKKTKRKDPRKKKEREEKEKKEKEEDKKEASHPDPDEPEKKEENKEDAAAAGKKKKGELALFSDANCDVDLYHSDPHKVIGRRIKVSNNMIVTCRMIEGGAGKLLTYDYPALTFQKKTGQDKMYEFMIPLSLAPRVIEAIKIIVNENKKFFQSEMAW